MKSLLRVFLILSKWLLLGLLAVWLFVIGANHFYPLTLAGTKNTSPVVVAADGQWLYAQTNTEQQWRFDLNISKLDPLYLKMLICFEDQRFWRHWGMDPLAMGRAIGQLLRYGHIASGGSTITMQLARLLEPKPRTVRSKIIEILRAFQLESTYTKEEILRAYLVLAPYGGNIEGVLGASMHYFGKLPYALSIEEAAILVSLPQSPESHRPDRHPKASRKARNKVLLVTKKAGILTEKRYLQASRSPISLRTFPYPRHAPHLSQKLLASTRQGHLSTTLDATLQIQLEQWASSKKNSLPKGTTLAALVVENQTAAIQAYLGSHNMFSPKVAGYIDMVQIARSPGSVLKPFIYGLGFEAHAIHPNTLIYDRETRFGDYLPHNYSRTYHGEVSIAYALQHSLNIPAVKVLQKIDTETFVSRISRLSGTLQIPKKQATLPIALGGFGISLWQIAQLYTALANQGSSVPIHLLPVKDTQQQVHTLLSPKAAKMTTAILRQVVPPKGHHNAAQRIAYKTGTSYGYRDLWTAAYTPDYTVIVWVGRPDNASQLKQSGREVAAPLAFEIIEMLEALHTPTQWGWSPSYLGNAVPQGLQHFDKMFKQAHASLQFIHPEKGARYRSAGCHEVIVPVQIEDGKAPYYWYIDGKAVDFFQQYKEVQLGTGAHTINIIDSAGETISRDIWVDMSDCQEKL